MSQSDRQNKAGGQLPDPPRIGVYVCHCGGNISDVVDVEKVVRAVSGLPGVVVAARDMFMCSDAGQQHIADDIRHEKLDRVVVAACSPSLHEMTFRRTLSRAGLNRYMYEHANIREQVSWCSKSDPQGATEKAIRLVGASVAKAGLLRPLEPIRVEARRHVVVIGGGVSGLRAAVDLARCDLQVSLIENTPFLGGRMAQLDRVYPEGDDARRLLESLIQEVAKNPRITVYTEAEVIAASGCVGDFQLRVRLHPRGGKENLAPEEITLAAGAVVMATGFDLYQPRQGEFAYGEHDGVITLSQLIRLLDPAGPTAGRLTRNGRPVKNVCFVHCVGSRQVAGVHEPGPDGRLNEYCSRVCCTATLQAALRIKERFPEVNVFDFYRDIRTYGRGHEQIYEDACGRGVTFFRYRAEEPPVVIAGEEGASAPLLLRVRDTLTFGEELDVPADLVVLAVGMIPRDISELVAMLKLPRSADGFLQEVHPKLRPVESAVEGVFLAGACQAPMDIGESCTAAAAAAAKAAALLGKGRIELDPFVARVDLDRCRGEGKCVEECKYRRAITLVESNGDGQIIKRAEVNPALCNGCGMCVAVCPHGAIAVEGWRLDQFEAMVDAIVADYSQVEKADA